jgi:hypothetical protein
MGIWRRKARGDHEDFVEGQSGWWLMMTALAVKEETMAMASPLMICYNNNKSTLALLLLLLRLEPQSQQLFPLKLFQSLALKESPIESLCFHYCSLFSAAAATAALPLPRLPSLSLPPLPALLLLLPLAPNFSLLSSSFSSGAIVVHLTPVPERFHDYPFIIISISELQQNAVTAAAAAEIE